MIGQTFGYLTVIEDLGVVQRVKGRGRSTVVCKCKCGSEPKKYVLYSLRSGNTNSCGCYQKERIAQACTTHGLKHHRIYSIWKGIKQRCYNKNSSEYKNYGGRGIELCSQWLNDFQHFYDWAVSNGYKDNLTIERDNVNGNYESTNCRWIPLVEQFNNTTKSRFLLFEGQIKTLSQWGREFRIKPSAISERLKRGQSVEHALRSIKNKLHAD